MWPLLPLPIPSLPWLLAPLALLVLVYWLTRQRGWGILAAALTCWLLAWLDLGSWHSVIHIPVHGLTICVGLLLAFWLINRRTPDLSAGQRLKLAIAGVLAGLVGSRLSYLLFYGFDTGILGLDGGMVLLGGVICAAAVVAITARIQGLNPTSLADACLPPLLIALALGRLGCWLNGCCFGCPSNLPWAHAMPATISSLHVHDSHLLWQDWSTYAAWRCNQLGTDIHALRHPVQVYEALASLILGLLLLPWRPSKTGIVAATALLSYGCWRFSIEFLRGDKAPSGLSDSQWMSIILVIAAITLLIKRAEIASLSDEVPSRAPEDEAC